MPLIAPTPPYRYRAVGSGQPVMLMPDVAVSWYDNHNLAVEYLPRQGLTLPQPPGSALTQEIQTNFGQYSFGISRGQLSGFLQQLAQAGYRILNTNADGEALISPQLVIQRPNLFVLA